MKTKLSVAAVAALFLTVGTAQAGVVDEIAGGGMVGQPGQSGQTGGGSIMGAGPDRGMRTAISLNAIQAAFDESDPRANVAHYRYDPDTTYKLRLREFMTTTVVLPPGEAVEGFSLADEYIFSFSPYTGKNEKTANKTLENIFTLSAKRPGADTSLTVIGKSGRVYSFYLRSDSVKSTHMPTLIAYIEDGATVSHAKSQPVDAVKPQTSITIAPLSQVADKTGEDAAATAEYLRSIGIADASKINFGYGAAGGEAALAPIKIFDDGYFTYFQFSKEGNLDKVSRLPVLYKVVDGYDTPINTRVEKGSLVAESISKGWTLRNGNSHLCIRAR